MGFVLILRPSLTRSLGFHFGEMAPPVFHRVSARFHKGAKDFKGAIKMTIQCTQEIHQSFNGTLRFVFQGEA